MAQMTTREAYDAVSQAIISLATGRVSSFQLGSRSVTFLDIDKLRSLKAELAAELAAEHTGPGLMPGGSVAFFDDRR